MKLTSKLMVAPFGNVSLYILTDHNCAINAYYERNCCVCLFYLRMIRMTLS